MYRVTETTYVVDLGMGVETYDYRWKFLARLHVWLSKIDDRHEHIYKTGYAITKVRYDNTYS